MSLHKLARELDETARQSAAMVDGVTAALQLLNDPRLPLEEREARASAIIVEALQGQDRIAQRCRNLGRAVRQMAELPASAPAAAYDEIWAGLELDELRVPALSGIARKPSHGDVELF